VLLVLDEGTRAYIERINIRGNYRTRDYVVRREFDINEGDPYNRALIDRAERRIKNLNFFKNVKISNEPGSAPDRVVIGAESEDTAKAVARLYPGGAPVVICDRRSAELVKYAANTFLAVKISFANEVAGLCERLGAKASTVLRGVGLDRRIGSEFLHPGPGFGGSCLPKDLAGFTAVADALGHSTPIARAAGEVNATARQAVLEKLECALGTLEGARVAVLGLAFKAGTDDTRGSPGVAVVRALASAGASVTAYDPIAEVADLPARVAADPYAAILGADAAVLITGCPQLAALDPDRIQRRMAGRVIIDAAGALDGAAAAAAGLDLYGVGGGLPTSFPPVIWRPLEWIATAAPGARPETAQAKVQVGNQAAIGLDRASSGRYPGLVGLS